MRLADILGRTVLWRWALAAYATTLIVATHWPNFRVGGPIARPDLYLHFAAFGVLGGLLVLAAPIGATGSGRSLAWAWLLGIGYAAVDELTQAIPGLGRTAGLDDYLADVVGVTLGVAAAAGLQRAMRGRVQPPITPSREP